MKSLSRKMGAPARYLKRMNIPSDDHQLIGRIHDLGIVELNFETYEELSQYIDCRYVFHCGLSMRNLVRRVDSLNQAGDLMWVDPSNWDNGQQMIDRYEWLDIATDVFLTRLISVFDCVLIFANDVLEAGLEPLQCRIKNLKKRGAPIKLVEALEGLQEDHEALRAERNARVHEGLERTHSSCDQTFRIAELFERSGRNLTGKDSLGRRISSARYMKEGLVQLQRDHNASMRKLGRRLEQVYDLLWTDFEDRFREKFRDLENGFGDGSKVAKIDRPFA